MAVFATGLLAVASESKGHQLVLQEMDGSDPYIDFRDTTGASIAKLVMDESDPNAVALVFDMHAGSSTIVPGIIIADELANYGFFDGDTQQFIAVIDDLGTSWARLTFTSDGVPAIEVGGVASTIALPGTVSGYTATDDLDWGLGTGVPASLEYTTADANANLALLDLPTGGATDVPVFLLSIADEDNTWYDGILEPTLALNNLAASGYVKLGFSGTTIAQLVTGEAATQLNITSPILVNTGSTSITDYTASRVVGFDAGASITFAVSDTTGNLAIAHTGSTKNVAWTTTGTFGLTTGGFTHTGAFASLTGIINLNVSSNYAVNIGTGTTTGTITLGGTGTQAIDIGVGAGIKTVTLGSATTSSATVIAAGTGDINITSTDDFTATASGAVALFSNAVAQTVTFGNATGVSSMAILSGTGDMSITSTDDFTATAVGAVALFSNAAEQTVTLGSITTASSLDLRFGTGNFTIEGVAASTITIGKSDQTGTIGLGVSSGILAMNIGTGTGAHTVSIANGAGVQTVVIGSTNTTSTTTIQAGSGGIVATGDVSISGSLTMTGTSGTWDPAEIADAGQESRDFTVTCELGDAAFVGAGVDITDMLVSCVVTAQNTVTVTLANETGGAIDVASSTWYVYVLMDD